MLSRSLNKLHQLSGDGKVPQSAFIPGSGASTGYDLLEIYLVSSQLGVNYTVSNATDFLEQEPGSTVKHLNWPIPNCVSSGSYNVRKGTPDEQTIF